MKLNISDDLKLPIDVTTQAMAFLGRRGSGKSYAATKLAELLHDAGAQFVAIDPVGIWYGLRLGADGKSKGLDVPIFGGLHGDIPLEATAGALLADVIIDRGISAVLDVSQFEADSDRAKFARDFAARFFHRKKSAPSAVHVFVEEAQEFIPQNPQKGEEQMLHAWQRMIRLGRNFGIGVSMLSQRPQDVNKKALNQTECLFCFQLTGPQERKAIEDWVSDKGLRADLSSILPGLVQGRAHVWSPVWLDINREIHVAEKRTFSAGSTPKVGARPIETKPLAQIELEQLHRDMAATIERAKDNDPKALRIERDRLRRELATRPKEQVEKIVEKIVERPAIDAKLLKSTESIVDRLQREGERYLAVGKQLADVAGQMAAALRASQQMAQPPRVAAVVRQPIQRAVPAPRREPVADAGEVGRGGLRRILTALAQRSGLTNRQIGVRAGLSAKSGTFATYLGKARSNGWISDQGDQRFITDAGLAALGDYEPLPSGQELLDYWLRELGESGAGRMLRALADAYPKSLSNEEIGTASDISHVSGTFATYMGKLRSLELVQGGRGATRASDEFFEGVPC